jgi:hypothetical protein
MRQRGKWQSGALFDEHEPAFMRHNRSIVIWVPGMISSYMHDGSITPTQISVAGGYRAYAVAFKLGVIATGLQSPPPAIFRGFARRVSSQPAGFS